MIQILFTDDFIAFYLLKIRNFIYRRLSNR